jgi:hypothetical protein
MDDDATTVKAGAKGIYGPIIKIRVAGLPIFREARQILNNGKPTGRYVYDFLKTPVTAEIIEIQQPEGGENSNEKTSYYPSCGGGHRCYYYCCRLCLARPKN